MAKLGFDPDGLVLKAQHLASRLIHLGVIIPYFHFCCLYCVFNVEGLHMLGLSELSLSGHTDCPGGQKRHPFYHLFLLGQGRNW